MLAKNKFQVEPETATVKVEKREPPKQVKSEPPKPDAKPICTYDIGSMQCTMHSTSGQGGETVPLEQGPEGFLVAKFSDFVHTTELCNLMLFAAVKAKVKPAAKKRPAAAPAVAIAPAEEASPPEPVAPAAAIAPLAEDPGDGGDKDDYGIMWYKKDRSIGIRAKFGAKAQIFPFGGKQCTKTEDAMREIAKQLVADLHRGVSAADAKQKGNRLCRS